MKLFNIALLATAVLAGKNDGRNELIDAGNDSFAMTHKF